MKTDISKWAGLSKLNTRTLAAAFLAFLACAAWAQPMGKESSQLGPFSAADALSEVSIANGPLSLSPDGKWVIYIVQESRRQQNSGAVLSDQILEKSIPGFEADTDIWLTDVESGSSFNLTQRKGTNWAPSWSPDGTRIAFFSDRTGSPRLWLYDLSTRATRQVSDEVVWPSEGDVPRWIDGGQKILARVLPEGESVETAAALLREASTQRTRVSQYPDSVITVYRANDDPKPSAKPSSARAITQNIFTRALRSDLALIDVRNGVTERILRGFNPAWYDVSPDGSVLAVAHAKGQVRGNNYRNLFDLLLVHLGEHHPVQTIATDVPSSVDTLLASFSPDGKWISYIALPADGPADCMLVRVADGTLKKAAGLSHPDLSNQYHAPRWGYDAKHLYFVVNNREIWSLAIGQNVARKLALLPNQVINEIVAPASSMASECWSPDQGQSIVVETVDGLGQGRFAEVNVTTGVVTSLLSSQSAFGGKWGLLVGSPDGRQIIYASEDAQHPVELWKANSQFQHRRQISQLNPRMAKYLFGRAQVIEWLSQDGEPLKGALLLPSGYKPGQRYPLIVFVYPGNQGSSVAYRFGLFGFAPYLNMQLLATRGYAVLYPDCPVRPGTIMQDVAKAVLPGVNRVIELGIADPARLGVMGASLGGYGTLSLIVQTPRFKAALMHAGLGDLISSYGEMGEDGSSYLIGIWEDNRRTQFGTPWSAPEKYIENSPVFHLDRIVTPLLILHGSKDYAVAPFLGEEIFVDLRRLGKTVVYGRYEGEGHEIAGYHNQLDYVERMIAWFDKYLKN